jgi:adenylate cyclase
MSIEIERKFLVQGEYKNSAHRTYKIKQGYISRVPERTVRVRIRDNKAFITIKGISSKNGLSRYEFEKEISLKEAEELFLLCEKGIIDKTRHLIEFEGNNFEVDEFHANHTGLVIAEIELNEEIQEFAKPEWLGEEVTGNKRYYNSFLSKESVN